jgi:hypothetical protein
VTTTPRFDVLTEIAPSVIEDMVIVRNANSDAIRPPIPI